MTITFENDNDIIVYALEKVIAYARRNQQMFVAQCVWWLASIIGLERGLISHIDNLWKKDRPVDQQPEDTGRDIRQSREVSAIPRDLQEDPRSNIELGNIHPDRVSRVGFTNSDVSELELDNSEPLPILEKAEQFLGTSRKERKAFKQRKKADILSRTRFGKILTKALSNKQRNYLQGISKETIAEYLANRK